MKFNSAEGMYHYLCNNGDLYNPVKEVYIFQYSENGALCYYCISEDHAAELALKSIEDGEYWGAYLGTGGHIYEAEEALEICNDFADENWINCREYAADILLKEAKKDPVTSSAAPALSPLIRSMALEGTGCRICSKTAIQS